MGNEFQVDIEMLFERTLLGMVFSSDQIASLVSQYPPQTIAEDEIIISEGSNPSEFIISLDEPLAMFSKDVSGQLGNAISIGVGRSFNLSALLSQVPYQYTLKTKSAANVLRIPWSEFIEPLKSNPFLKNYLTYMVEKEEFKSLGKDCDRAGCSREFKINLLGRLEYLKLSPHNWLSLQNETKAFSFILIEGILQASRKTESRKALKSWNLPTKVWMSWVEADQGSAARLSVRSQTTVTFLRLNPEEQQKLKNQFPEDYALYAEWLKNSGINAEIAPDDSADVEVDLAKILENGPDDKRPWWKSFPFVRQNDQMDCGPACLAMISSYWGRDLSLQFWRGQLSTDREGTSVFDLALTAEKNGIISHAIAVDGLGDIDQDVLPVIVLRKYHYMVLYKVTKKDVILGDPGYGIVKMSREEFADGFENCCLILRPTDEFFEKVADSSPYKHFYQLAATFRSDIIRAFICSFLIVLLSLLPPALTQTLFDDVMGTKDLELLYLVVLGFCGTVVFNELMTFSRAYYVNYIASKFDFFSKSSFVHKMFSLPYQYFATRHVGDFTRRLQEFERVRSFITNTGLNLILSLVSVVIYSSVLFFYSPKVAVIVLLLSPPFLFISMAFSKKLTILYADTFSRLSEQDSYLTDVIKGIMSIKSIGGELSARRRYEERLAQTLQSKYKFQLTSVTLVGLVNIYYFIARYSTLTYMVYLAMKGELSPGQVMALSMIAIQVLEPFEKIAYQWADFQEFKSVLSRLNDVYLSPSESQLHKSTGQRLNEFRGEVEFKDVWFRYGGDGSDWVLKGVSFRIEPGQNIAVVGPSGSGKSTIVQLLVRMYVPTKGQIFIDGKDIREFDTNWLREKIGLITQESHLFPGTIAENIAFSYPEIDIQRVKEAARVAEADVFIENKPGQYRYQVPSGGYGFSGGEKQRLTLARTLYRNPSMLILDEATSALDGISERNFLKNISDWAQSRTMISIAHRYSTVKYSSHALVLQSGRVVGFGPPEELVETSDIFKKLFLEISEEQAESEDKSSDDQLKEAV